MSLNDELKAAKSRMDAIQEADKKKKKAPKKRAASEWSLESEIVAYYLYKADSSKFLKENYAKKRKVSVRSMSMKINMFGELERGGKPKSESVHARHIIDTYGHLTIDQILKVAISIHRGEFNQQAPAEAEAAPAATEETVVRKEVETTPEANAEVSEAPEANAEVEVEVEES